MVGDELDERDDPDVTETVTYVVDIADLDAPVLHTTYTNNTCAIDHNLMVRGNRSFQANYSTGLRVFDISNINAVTEVAFFDTRPEDNAVGFDGLWGVFTDFPSNVIVASDRQRGLFVFREGNPPTVRVPILPGVVDGIDHDIPKQRYLSIDLRRDPCGSPLLDEARMRVSLLDNGCSVTGRQCLDDASCNACDADSSNAGDPCIRDSQCDGGLCLVSGETCEEQSPPVVLGFVGDPVAAGGDAPPDTFIAPVVNADPGFRLWEERLFHVTDCEIAPGRVYRIEIEDAKAPGLFKNLDLRTTPKPVGKDWGDIVGHFTGVNWTAPNFLVNVDDINAMLKFLSLKPAPHVTVVDLVGPGPTFVNMDVNATDLLIIIRAFLGELYPPFALVDGGYPDLQNGESLTDCPAN